MVKHAKKWFIMHHAIQVNNENLHAYSPPFNICTNFLLSFGLIVFIQGYGDTPAQGQTKAKVKRTGIHYKAVWVGFEEVGLVCLLGSGSCDTTTPVDIEPEAASHINSCRMLACVEVSLKSQFHRLWACSTRRSF